MKKRGFTIVESLIAISILIVVVMGVLTAVQTGLSSYIFSKEQVIAFYLAQEGFEQIRNMRDENKINGRNWLSGLAQFDTDPCAFGQACVVDPVLRSDAVRCSSPGNCPYIYQDPVTGFYWYNSDTNKTIFKREIALKSINQNEISVTVTVDWNKGAIQRQFKARENIFDWQ